MVDMFNLLCLNDLVWFFIINNYLLGCQLQVFDLLYWNVDQICMFKVLYFWYLDNMYCKNCLFKGEFSFGEVLFEFDVVKMLIYMQVFCDDYIVFYLFVYKGVKCFGGLVCYMMVGFGYIVGVINYFDVNKYQYWINDELLDMVDDWIVGVVEYFGFWWFDWCEWFYECLGEDVLV